MTHNFDVHVCLVSGQAAPNLLPVLDARFAPKRIFMLVTPEMEENANGLSAVFKKHGIKADFLSIADPYDFDSIQGNLLDFLDKPENEKTALNVTGGTKIMALAAHSAFSIADRPIFYVREDNNSVIIMHNCGGSEKYPPIDLKSNLKLKDYFRAYGYSADPKESIHKPGFAKELVDNQVQYRDALGLLNKHVCTDDNRQTLSFSAQNTTPMCIILELCKKYDFLDFNDRRIDFNDAACRKYVCGGWLEAHTRAVVNSISRSKLQTLADQGIEIIKKNVPNDLDVAFLAKNALHVIECKTGRLTRERGGDTLYKLKTITQTMGLKTKPMLVTYRNLDSEDTKKRKPHTRRARQYGIEVVEGDELRRLKEHLEKWIAQ